MTGIGRIFVGPHAAAVRPRSAAAELWLDGVSALARTVRTAARSTVDIRRRKRERALGDILASPTISALARDTESRIRHTRDQLPALVTSPGRVEAAGAPCGHDLRTAVIQRENTEGLSCRAVCRAHDLRRGHVQHRAGTIGDPRRLAELHTPGIDTPWIEDRIQSHAATQCTPNFAFDIS